MIPAWLAPLAPSPLVLGAALVLDLAIGDPAYAAHPVRLIGAAIAAVERALRRLGLDGYGGGVLLTVVVAVLWVTLASAATSRRTIGVATNVVPALARKTIRYALTARRRRGSAASDHVPGPSPSP